MAVCISDVVCFLGDLIPDVKVAEGCYTLIGGGGALDTKQAVHDWIKELNGDCRSAEYNMNHVHIVDFLHSLEGDYTDDDLKLICRVYVAILKDVLATSFPRQDFDIITEGEANVEKQPDEFFVTFCRRVRKPGEMRQ